jgi:hypothetical protein
MFSYPTINALTGRIVQILRPVDRLAELEVSVDRVDELVRSMDDPIEEVTTLSRRELIDRIALEFDALGNAGDDATFR